MFSKVKDDDIRALGMDPRHARPEWLLIKVLPIPPPHVRPSIELDASMRSEDDLTHKYAEIIKTNNALRNDIVRDAACFWLEAEVLLLCFALLLPTGASCTSSDS